jgi:hypothetical protein
MGRRYAEEMDREDREGHGDAPALRCAGCGYDLHATAAELCPECGKPVSETIDDLEAERAMALLFPGRVARRPQKGRAVASLLLVHVVTAIMMALAIWGFWRAAHGESLRLGSRARGGGALSPATGMWVMGGLMAVAAVYYAVGWWDAVERWSGMRVKISVRLRRRSERD